MCNMRTYGESLTLFFANAVFAKSVEIMDYALGLIITVNMNKVVLEFSKVSVQLHKSHYVCHHPDDDELIDDLVDANLI